MEVSKSEARCYLALIENQRKKASMKAVTVTSPTVRAGWEQVALALRYAAELVQEDIKSMEARHD